MHCPAGYRYAAFGLLQQDKMKWQVVDYKIAVSRFYRLKEWPRRLILGGTAAENSLDRMKRCT